MPNILKPYEVYSVECFIQAIKKINGEHLRGLIYRGQKDKDWKITSSLSRFLKPDISTNKKVSSTPEISCETIKNRKKQAYNAYTIFKYSLPPFYQEITSSQHLFPTNDLALLMLAQHYGLPTRLIDWTLNPLVALYFAVENTTKEDNIEAAVYVYKGDNAEHHTADEFSFIIQNHLEKSLHKCKEKEEDKHYAKSLSHPLKTISTCNLENLLDAHQVITPYLFDKRMQAQSCIFTFTTDLLQPFSGQTEKIIIKNPYTIKTELITLDIMKTNIYPSIEGLCESLSFCYMNPAGT